MNNSYHKTLLDLLRAQSTHWGLSAPTFAWWAAGVLLIAPLLILIYLWWRIGSEARRLKSTALSVEQLRAREPPASSQGLSAAAYESLVQVFAASDSFRGAWNAFNSLIVPRRSSSGEYEYRACESSDTAFSEAAVIESRLAGC